MKFNNTVKIEDLEIIQKIHLNYRLIFFKDSVAGRWIDEGTVSVLTTLLNDNYQDILNHIFQLSSAPVQILSSMKSADFSTKISSVKFLLEICNASRLMILDTKTDFFANLVEGGLFECLTEFLKMDTAVSDSVGAKTDKTAAYKVEEMFYSSDLSPEFSAAHGVNRTELFQVWSAEILTHVLQALPLKVKNTLLSESSAHSTKKPFLSSLLDILFTSALEGPKYEISEFYKSLLDPESTPLKNDVLDAFYEDYISEVTNFLSEAATAGKTRGSKEIQTAVCLALELLGYCARNHGYRMRHFITHGNILQSLRLLYLHKDKCIKVGMVKLLRALIGLKDESMCRYITTNDLLKPIMELAGKNKRDNLIKSAILELFDFIQKENMSILMEHLMEHYSDFVTSGPLSKYSPLKGIKIRYEQHKDAGEDLPKSLSELEKY